MPPSPCLRDNSAFCFLGKHVTTQQLLISRVNANFVVVSYNNTICICPHYAAPYEGVLMLKTVSALYLRTTPFYCPRDNTVRTVRVSHDNSVLYPVTALNVQLCKCACVPLQPHNVVPVTTLYLYVCHVTTPYYSIVPVTTLQMYLCLMTIPYYCLRDNPVKQYP